MIHELGHSLGSLETYDANCALEGEQVHPCQEEGSKVTCLAPSNHVQHDGSH